MNKNVIFETGNFSKEPPPAILLPIDFINIPENDISSDEKIVYGVFVYLWENRQALKFEDNEKAMAKMSGISIKKLRLILNKLVAKGIIEEKREDST